MVKRAVFVGTIIVSLLSFSAISVVKGDFVAPTIYTVDDDIQDLPDADFTRIQEAVNAANPGDIIFVFPGTYTENVDVDKKGLVIQSASGADVTIVQAAYFYDYVFAISADNVTISGFTIKGALKTGAGAYGIYLNNANYCEISNNNVSDNHGGIWLFRSSNNTLTNNTFDSNAYDGIGLENSSHNTLAVNTISNNRFNFGIFGEELSHFTHSIDTSNMINGKPIQYLVDKKDLVIDSSWNVGYLGIVNCMNITVEGLTLTNNRQGILLAYSTDSRIENVNVRNNNIGIRLIDSSHNTIINNMVNSNSAYGIWLFHSSNNIIIDNTVSSDRRAGIALGNSSNNTLIGNTASYNYYGILLEDNSSNNILTNNTVNSNWGYGVGLYSSSNNKIHLNNLTDNGENAGSYSSTNIWNSPEPVTYTFNGSTYTNYLGNYWSDYIGSDANGDGVGDIPYSIDWDKDNYPLVMPFENYVLTEVYYNPQVSIPPYAPCIAYGNKGTTFTFVVEVKNMGTVDDTIDLEASSSPESLPIFLSEASVTLPPSESKLIYIKTTSKTNRDEVNIVASSGGDSTKKSSCKVIMFLETHPLYFSFNFLNSGHVLNFAGSNVKFSKESLSGGGVIELIFEPKTRQKDFDVTITDETINESIKIPIETNIDCVAATDFDVAIDGYSFPNWGITIPKLDRGISYCFGMSETSILYFNFRNGLSPAEEPPKPEVYADTYSLPKNIAQGNIRVHQMLGMMDYLDTLGILFDQKKEYYVKLKPSLENDGNPMILTMRFASLRPAHSVVAYRIVEIGKEAYILVYDNRIEYGKDSLKNSFQYIKYNSFSGELSYSDIGLGELKKFIVTQPKTRRERQSILITCPVHVTIKDEKGRRISSDGTNEIPTADMLITDEEKIFYLPADTRFLAKIDAYDSGEFSYTRVSPVEGDVFLTATGAISINDGTKAFVDMNPNTIDYVMKIDYNNDGILDEVRHPDYIADLLAQTVIAAVVFTPPTWCTNWLDDTGGNVRCYIGTLEGSHDVTEIDVNTVRLNDAVPASTSWYRIKDFHTGYTGKVLEVIFNRRDAFLTLGNVSPGNVETIEVSGEFKSGAAFEGKTTITVSMPATIDFDPDTLNLKGAGKWVTVYIELPEGYGVERIVEDDDDDDSDEADDVDWDDYRSLINISTVRLNGQVPAISDPEYGFVRDPELEDRDENGLPELMVKFDRVAVQEILEVGNEIEITIIGTVRHDTDLVYFEGKDTIRVIDKADNQDDDESEPVAKAKPAPDLLVFSLGQNFSNPFNPDTWIPYQLAEDVNVAIRIYNASGKIVRTLDLGHKPAGFYTTKSKAAYWDGRNEAGEQLTSGIYFYTIQAGEFIATRKMVIK